MLCIVNACLLIIVQFCVKLVVLKVLEKPLDLGSCLTFLRSWH